MALFTKNERYLKAVWWKNKLTTGTGCWVGFGQTTPWVDEQNPPNPNIASTAVSELTYLKKVSKCTFVQEDANGTIEYNQKKYKEITDSEAATGREYLIYISVQLAYSEVPQAHVNKSVRQLGIYSGLQGSWGTKTLIEPSEVTFTNSELHILDNFIATKPTSGQTDIWSFIVSC